MAGFYPARGAGYVGLLLIYGSLLARGNVDKVLLYGLDGWSNDCSDQCNPGGLAEMVSLGSYTNHARGAWPALRAVNWAGLLIGGGSVLHGILSDKTLFPAGCTGPPTIFDVIKEWNLQNRHNRRTIFSSPEPVVNYLMDDHLSVDSTPAYSIHDPPGLIVEDIGKADEKIFMVWHIPQLLFYGTNEQFCSANYCQAMELIFDVIQTIHDTLLRNNPHETVLSMVVSMGGGYENYYGMNLKEELIRLPLVVRGHGVRANYRMIETYLNSDIRSVVFLSVNLPLPPPRWYSAYSSPFR